MAIVARELGAKAADFSRRCRSATPCALVALVALVAHPAQLPVPSLPRATFTLQREADEQGMASGEQAQTMQHARGAGELTLGTD